VNDHDDDAIYDRENEIVMNVDYYDLNLLKQNKNQAKDDQQIYLVRRLPLVFD
jgi:hypothetical protein